MGESFFIKFGYRDRAVAETIEQSPGDYWNATRISHSLQFQRYDFLTARDFLLSRPKPMRSVCDVGCGYPAKTNELLAPVAEKVVVMDQPTLSAVIAEKFPALKFISVDLERPEIGLDEKFDAIMFSGVIEHLIDPTPSVLFLCSLCRPDGHIFISTVERDVKRGPDNMQSTNRHHVREWNQREFRDYLESCGLKVVQHILVPGRRMSFFDDMAFHLNLGWLWPSRWAGLQLAICSPA
jgi:SAM-dependent methyltransferase